MDKNQPNTPQEKSPVKIYNFNEVNHKPVTSPTPPPSPQSYWTGKNDSSEQKKDKG